jgi:hypothetical protein
MNRVRRAPSRAHSQNHSRRAGHDVSTGKHSFARRALRFFAGLNVSPFVRAQPRRGALHDRIRSRTDRNHRHK